MTAFTHSVHWTKEHSHGVLETLRILLGLVLFVKALQYIAFPEALARLMGVQDTVATVAFANYILLAHLIGGLMIVIGLRTRWAVAAQLPVLVMAVYKLASPGLTGGQAESLWMTVFLMVMLGVFAFYGSGDVSVDEALRESEVAEEDRALRTAQKRGFYKHAGRR